MEAKRLSNVDRMEVRSCVLRLGMEKKAKGALSWGGTEWGHRLPGLRKASPFPKEVFS